MLNTFPALLTFSTFSPLILRVIIGVIFIDLGILKLRGEKDRWLRSFETLNLRPASPLLGLYAVVQIACGGLLVLGLWTQVAALIFVITGFSEFYIEQKMSEVLKRDITFYLLLLVVSISLLLTGAGAYAIDIPL